MFKKQIKDKQLKERNERVNQYKASENIGKTFRENLNQSKNITQEIYYLSIADEDMIHDKDDCRSVLSKVCKTWGIVPLSYIFRNEENVCLWGIITACNIFYQQHVQKLESKVQSLENTIEKMGKIIKVYHDQENQNLNQMNHFTNNEMVRREQSNGELNI
jgi:hypothetical protein